MLSHIIERWQVSSHRRVDRDTRASSSRLLPHLQEHQSLPATTGFHISTHLAGVGAQVKNKRGRTASLLCRGGGHIGWQRGPAASGVRDYTARELWDFFKS